MTQNVYRIKQDICDIGRRIYNKGFAAANDGKTIYAPTAVGFCMWVRRKAWQQAGGFDTIFGRGYGEEVDFCCKVAKLGWCHLIAADVFVFHEGGVAFGNEGCRNRPR